MFLYHPEEGLDNRPKRWMFERVVLRGTPNNYYFPAPMLADMHTHDYKLRAPWKGNLNLYYT